MTVLVEDAAESVASVYLEVGGGVRRGQWCGLSPDQQNESAGQPPPLNHNPHPSSTLLGPGEGCGEPVEG
jgi:hypothetical protein